MSSTPFRRSATSCETPSLAQRSFVHCFWAQFARTDDWCDDDPDPFSDEPWDPDELDYDEPQPEPGDFWPEIDDD